MTLITHLSNSRITLVSGDSRRTSNYMPSNDHRKVYNFSDCAVGYFGQQNEFSVWLDYDLNEADRKKVTLIEVLSKADIACKNNAHPLDLVIAGFDKSMTFSIPNSNVTILPFLGVSFSPMYVKGEIDLNHTNTLYELFQKQFKAHYNNEFNLELIEDNSRLKEFLTAFQHEIDFRVELNRGFIHGPLCFHIVDRIKRKISPLRKCG